MNKLQASLSSSALIASMLMVMPCALTAQTAPLNHEEAHRRAEAGRLISAMLGS